MMLSLVQQLDSLKWNSSLPISEEDDPFSSTELLTGEGGFLSLEEIDESDYKLVFPDSNNKKRKHVVSDGEEEEEEEVVLSEEKKEKKPKKKKPKKKKKKKKKKTNEIALDGEKDEDKVVEDEDEDEDGVHGSSLQALIVTPTRELALQVADHIKEVAKFTNVRVVPIVGGMSTEKQERLLNYRPEIVVGTPGRLWELMSGGDEHLSEVGNLIIVAA